MTHDSQRLAIQRYMAAGNTITPRIAYKICGTFRLAARICEVKKHFKVATRKVYEGRRCWSEYWIPAARERARALVAA